MTGQSTSGYSTPARWNSASVSARAGSSGPHHGSEEQLADTS
jgi:hypothetical protein